jgi:hypothetical protein
MTGKKRAVGAGAEQPAAKASAANVRKFSDSWFDDPPGLTQRRSEWLRQLEDDDSLLWCAWCSGGGRRATFLCNSNAVKQHAAGAKHKEAAGGRGAFLIRDGGASIVQQRAAQQAESRRQAAGQCPLLRTQFALLLRTLRRGRPMGDYSTLPEVLLQIQAPHVSTMHWRGRGGGAGGG